MSGNDTLFLNKAVDLGDRLLPIFDTVRFLLIYAPIYDTDGMSLCVVSNIALRHPPFIREPGYLYSHS